MTSLDVGKRKNEDYYCGLIYSELIEGPLRETELLHRLDQQDVLAVEVRECLVLMEKNGSICKTGAGENVWQLASELHRGDFSENTVPSRSSLNAAGHINLETSAPVNCHQDTEIDQRSKPTLENLKKIISVFVEPNMNLKPKDVAQKSGIGKSRKSVNKLLYLLAKKKVLKVTTSDGKDPKWNKDPSALYSDRDLHEWAAELEYGITRLPAPTPVVSHQWHHHHNRQQELKTYFRVGETTVIDDMVPTEIKLMADKRSVPLYLKLLESGSEKKRDIRLVIVGKKGAGKTSLIKRLFSEENTDVTSTNGIEIHTIKCKAMTDDGIWNKLDGSNEETEIHARLLKQFKGTIDASVEKGAHKAAKENTLITILYKRNEESKESETVTQQPKKRELQVTTESQVEPPVTSQQRNQALEQAKMILKPCLNLMLIYKTKRSMPHYCCGILQELKNFTTHIKPFCPLVQFISL
ncbi:uncharacterized protein LOC127712721 isoform X3 [Mytilus californianus]|uniref:uncharacterized protein LOC127712721 isoform X3 n=1 Tax=Mytilus californianus TaxID=6549 RepID=UPI002247B8FB|nr:uncharacterized protein LOC127712721 isoform X3 [Mytilus californianus]